MSYSARIYNLHLMRAFLEGVSIHVIAPVTSGTAVTKFRPSSCHGVLRRPIMLPAWILATAAIVLMCSCGGLASIASHGGGGATDQGTTQGAISTATSHSGTSVPTKVRPTATPTHTPQWTTAQTFKGNGISKTGTFAVNDSQWKILWSCNPAAYGSEYNLIADLTQPGADFGDSVVNVICKQDDKSTTSGETMEYTQGTFYLDINSEASWTFQIEVLK